jgi:translocation and assembly module TamB
LTGIERGYRLENLQGTVRILPKHPYTLDVDLRARDAQRRLHTVIAAVQYAPSQIEARVTNLTITLTDGTWKLAQPAVIAQRGTDFFVDDVSMRNGDRSFSVDGRLSLSGSQSLRLSVDRIPLETVRGFFPDAPDVTGTVSGQAQVAGTASAPDISARMTLDESRIGGQKYRGLSAALTYSGGRADLDAVLLQDKVHRLEASGSVPVTLSWSNGWRFETSGNLTGRVQSTGLSIALLNAFSGKAIRDIAGELALDLQVRGTVADPSVEGSLRLRDGKLTPVDLGIEVSSINAEGRLETRGITVARLTASANGGKLSGSGFIGLQKFASQRIDLTLTANRWPAINTQRYQADVNGAVSIRGSLSAPRVIGNIEVVRAQLRPDLAFLKQGATPVKRDSTIKVVGGKRPAPTSARPEDKAPPLDNEVWKNAAIQVQVIVPNNAWLRHPNANVELSGKVTLEKAPEEDLAITGLLEAVRGWIGFQGRRFNVTRGVVSFGGGDKINPSLDIVAEYRTGEYAISVNISGRAEKPALTLASQPQMEQSDILAVLLFGKPIAALNQGEAVSLQQSAINLTTGFAASQVAKAVSQTLNLQQFGLDLSDVEVADGRVRVGRYVGDKTFFSVGQEIAGSYGREVAVEFRITEDWKLGVSSSTEGTSGVDVIWHKRY